MAKFDYRKLAKSVAGRPDELMFTPATGAAANSNVAVTAISGVPSADITGVQITAKDALLAVIDMTTWADLVHEASVTSTGNIQTSSTSTAGHNVLVIWLKRHD